jgi:DNA-binding response OmpR family regulator
LGVKPHVLIVEDDERIAELVTKNLDAAGFASTRARSGEQAQELLPRLEPALIVLDLSLPGIDGYEFTRRLRRERNTLILMLTARTSESDKVLGFELGADDYLTKPFGTQEHDHEPRGGVVQARQPPSSTSMPAPARTARL